MIMFFCWAQGLFVFLTCEPMIQAEDQDNKCQQHEVHSFPPPGGIFMICFLSQVYSRYTLLTLWEHSLLSPQNSELHFFVQHDVRPLRNRAVSCFQYDMYDQLQKKLSTLPFRNGNALRAYRKKTICLVQNEQYVVGTDYLLQRSSHPTPPLPGKNDLKLKAAWKVMYLTKGWTSHHVRHNTCIFPGKKEGESEKPLPPRNIWGKKT